jgi:tRNA threonylcarbamoyladenosine biosynthesis protein TsaB
MILALETSSSLCAVCLYDEDAGKVVAEVSNDIGRGHAERLMDDIERALKCAGLTYKDVTALACGVGPGSFTGIRVGVAAARGFGLALKVPVHGVTSLQAIALQAREIADSYILAAIDAGREDVYLQKFDTNAMPVDSAKAVHVSELSTAITASPILICGSGAARFSSLAPSLDVSIYGLAMVATAAAVAKSAANTAMSVSPKPLYLRAPDAKPQTGFVIARQ